MMQRSLIHHLWVVLMLAGLLGCGGVRQAEVRWQPLPTERLAQPLTLEECLAIAQQSDVRAAVWRARLVGARAALAESRQWPNPSLSIGWDDVGLFDEAGKGIASRTYGLSFPLFFWWTRPHEIAAARAEAKATVEEIAQDQRKLDLDVADAYFTLVSEQRKLTLAGELVQVASESLRLAEKQRELELVSPLEVARAETERLASQSSRADAAGQLRRDQLAFAFALGTDRPCFPAVVDVSDVAALPAVDLNHDTLPEECRELVKAADPAWRRAAHLREAAAAKLEVERRKAIPLADLGASGGPKDAAEGVGSAHSLDMPLPLLNRNRAGIARASAELSLALADEEQARREALATASTAWERYRTAAHQWTAYAEPLAEAAARNARAAARLFAEGEIPYSEVLQAQRDAAGARLAAIDAWRDHAAAAWQLAYLLRHAHTSYDVLAPSARRLDGSP